MSLFRALALPIVALAVVGLFGVAMLTGGGGETPQAFGPKPATPTSTPAPELARREPGNVCQGTFSRPAAGEPHQFAPEYTKQRRVLGISIVGIGLVSDAAFDRAEATIKDMFAGTTLAEPLTAEGAYIIITHESQRVLDLPEFSCLAGSAGSGVYDHVCGVADRADYPVVAVAELDLTGDRAGPCKGLNILYHELGHLVHGWVLGPADFVDVRYLYQDALDQGKYQGMYAARNTHEYFAEATQAYFLSLNRSGTRDRVWLEFYDPGLYALMARVYGAGE